MNNVLAIIGCGDLGLQIANYAIVDNHYDRVVFFDDFANEKSKNGYEIIGTTKDILDQYSNKQFDELLIGIGYKHLEVRKQLFEEFDNIIPFGRIVHSSCWIDPTANIKAGSIIYPGCTIDAGAVIDNNSVLNLACTIAHDTYVGKHCFLSPRVAIAGFVKIHDLCVIGINSTLIDNIIINEQIQIGGGSVVIKSLQKKGLYVGNPHKFIR